MTTEETEWKLVGKRVMQDAMLADDRGRVSAVDGRSGVVVTPARPWSVAFLPSTSTLFRTMLATTARTTATHTTRVISALCRRRRAFSPAQARSDYRPRRQYSTPAPTSEQRSSSSSSSGTGVATEGASLEPPPAGGHLPTVANSRLLRSTRDSALRTPGIVWKDNEDGSSASSSVVTGRDTTKMNVYQAVRDAMRCVDFPFLV